MALNPTRGGGAIPRSLLMAAASLLHLTPQFPNPNPRFPKSARFSARFSARADRNGGGSGGSPPAEKKSLAVATGELFLGIASLLTRPGRRELDVVANGGGVYLKGEERGEEIAKVMEDPVDEEVVWEQREKDVEAEKERKKVTSPGFSFSAAGLLFPYHLGVAQCLLDKGYIKETTPLAGSSAGAIVCAVIASGNSMQEALQITKVLADDCRLNGTAFRLGAVLREILNNFLPDDIHTRCNGRIRVAITQLFWRPKGLLVDQFDSKEDLINAVFTSSFIPGYLAPRPATMFRNRLCVDGGLTLFMPPTSASKTFCRDNLAVYASDHQAKFMMGYCATYIFMQTFMIPGTIFMSLLAGALFGVVKGVILVVFTATSGACSCYFLSKLIGRPLINWLWPERLRFFQSEIAKRREKLLNYMLFLRITPTLPNTFINVASPIVDIPFHIFLLATMVGLIPASYITVRAGLALGDLKSVRDLYDFKTLVVLFMIGFISIAPTILKRKRTYE